MNNLTEKLLNKVGLTIEEVEDRPIIRKKKTNRQRKTNPKIKKINPLQP